MPLTDKPTVVGQYILDLLKSKSAVLGVEADRMYYGDQEMIGATPALAVEEGTFTRELSGKGLSGQSLNQIRVFILVYIAKIQDVQTTRKATNELAEKIMMELHKDINMGGNVIHGFVVEIEPGYAIRSGVLMRSARITWQGITKTLIPISA